MGSLKREKVIAGIRDSIDLFLNQNSDKFGFCHVEEIDVSGDLKSARIFISFFDKLNTKKKVDLLNKSSKDIFEQYNKKYHSRYFPTLKFISFDDEFSI
jgi:ribosome-binding factor A